MRQRRDGDGDGDGDASVLRSGDNAGGASVIATGGDEGLTVTGTGVLSVLRGAGGGSVAASLPTLRSLSFASRSARSSSASSYGPVSTTSSEARFSNTGRAPKSARRAASEAALWGRTAGSRARQASTISPRPSGTPASSAGSSPVDDTSIFDGDSAANGSSPASIV